MVTLVAAAEGVAEANYRLSCECSLSVAQVPQPRTWNDSITVLSATDNRRGRIRRQSTWQKRTSCKFSLNRTFHRNGSLYGVDQ